jgi:hypothetical protein
MAHNEVENLKEAIESLSQMGKHRRLYFGRGLLF